MTEIVIAVLQFVPSKVTVGIVPAAKRESAEETIVLPSSRTRIVTGAVGAFVSWIV